ncbi:MAG: HDIG domain-containing metalloprotein [Candidatus Aenigmatarchaeota archaeon]
MHIVLPMIKKTKAEDLVKEEVDTENLRKHMYAVSAVMEELASRLDRDEELWSLVGLLHDVDYEETKDDPKEHALRSAKMLEGEIPQEALRAIKAHNHKHTDVDPESDLDHALIAADAISGLIIATALVMPDKRLDQARTESVLKKFDDSSFARNIDRDRILHCEEFGMGREEFTELSLEALQDIHEKLGL